jgi:hypothetical protein
MLKQKGFESFNFHDWHNNIKNWQDLEDYITYKRISLLATNGRHLFSRPLEPCLGLSSSRKKWYLMARTTLSCRWCDDETRIIRGLKAKTGR